MKSINLFSVLTLSFISLSTFAQNSGKIVLEKNQKFQVESNTVSNITQEAMGQTMESKSTSNSTQVIEIKDKKETGYVISTTMTKMKMTTNMMGQDVSFDSDKKEDLESEQGKSLGELLNKPKENEMDFSGKLITKPSNDEDKNDMMAMFAKFTSGSDAAPSFQPIPEGVKVGDTWKVDVDDKDMKANTVYTVQSVNGNEIKLIFVTKQKITTTMEQNGMEMNLSSEGSITGDETVESKTSVIKEKNFISDSKATIEVMGQSMPMTTKTTGSIKVKSI